MAGANTNFVTGPGLRHGSLIYTHENYRYSKHKQLSDGCTRLKCTNYKTCRGAATLSADGRTITPRLPHNHLNDRDNIVASQFREGLRGNITDRDADVKAIYNNLADLFTLTHSPRTRDIVPFESIASTMYTVRGTLPRRDAECPICLGGRDPEYILVGCGHPYCEDCARALQRGTGICAVCQQAFTDINIVHK